MRNRRRNIKQYEELTFTDDFLFCRILQNNPPLCKELTELILDKKIGQILKTEEQKEIRLTADGKGIRFDVYLEDDLQTVYDIEMQTGHYSELSLRARYYQGMIDLNILRSGARYRELKKSYVIFICLENPFSEKDLHKYTFSTMCHEKPGMPLGDGATKIFLSAEGTEADVSEEMQGFLQFLTTRKSTTNFTDRLAVEVEKAKKHEQWRLDYMTLLERDEMMRDEGREEGLKEGETKVLVNLICGKLRKGKSLDQIANELESTPEDIKNIVMIAESFASDYPEEMVLEEVKNSLAVDSEMNMQG